jgi:hypothetical protein
VPSYKEIMNKIRQSKNRIANLKEDVAFEEKNHEGLILELSAHVSKEAGVNIGKKPTNPDYNLEAVTERMMSLRKVNSSFNTIARILNHDGFKTRFNQEFTATNVRQLYTTACAKQIDTAPLMMKATG